MRVAILGVVLSGSVLAFGAEPEPPLLDLSTSNRYCGLISAVSCINATGVSARVEEIDATKYVSATGGSTVTQIQALVADFGISTAARSGLSVLDLRRINCPTVLHVRVSKTSRDLQHWVAYLGSENGLFVVFDSNSGRLTLSAAELCAIWDGEGIVCNRSQTSLAVQITIWRTQSLLMFFAFAACFSAFAKPRYRDVIVDGKRPLAELFRQGVGMTLTAIVATIIFHSYSPSGLIPNRLIAGEVARRFYHREAKEIGTQELLSEIDAPNTLILDVRFDADFRRGSIPSAISMPINSSLLHRQSVLHAVNRASKIIVYCQSEHCLFSNDIAQFLLFNGFSDVEIYFGGYAEWEKSDGLRKPAELRTNL